MTYFTRHRYAVVAVAATVCLLAGCSEKSSTANSTGTPQVASLQTSSAKAEPAGSVDDQRPLVPLDETNEDLENLRKAWGACVTAEGGPAYKNPRWVLANRSAKNDAILKKCRALEPETVEERQSRQDRPAFLDNQRQFYLCAKKAGYSLTTPDENGRFGLTKVGPNGDAQSPKIEACRIAAFAD